MSSIDIRGLSMGYGGSVVLRDLDLHVVSGGITAILGASGSGKSTLLRCVAGLLRPDAGRISLGERVVCGPGVWVPPERRRVGLVPQEGSLFPHLSVADNVGFGLRGRGRATRVAAVLDLVGLPGAGAMRPHELSGGMQQRVAVARALAPEPAVVLLDEPFSALDAGLRDGVRCDVFAALRAAGATAVLVTHDQQEAFAVADAVAVMMDAAIPQVAGPAELYLNPASLDVATFVGDTVLLAGTVHGSTVVQTALGRLEVKGRWPVGAGGVVAMRPEDFSVDRAGTGLTTAVVRDVRYHGHDTVLTAEAGGQQVSIRVLGRPALTPGDPVGVTVLRPGTFFPDAQGSGGPRDPHA
jgi:iron(III) transport system ATP-binding protein